MDPAERLTAYLDGQLTPDEHAAVEAELAADPRLRAALADLQRADAALADASPTALPSGAGDRLRSRLRPVLEEMPERAPSIDDEPASQAPGPVGDELSARRTSRWHAPLAIAAAAVGVLVVGGVVVSGLQDDADEVASPDEMADADIMEDSADDAEQPEMEAEEAPEEELDDGAALASSLPDAPPVVDEGADLDDARVEAVLEGEELQLVRDLELGSPEGDEVAASWQRELGVRPTETPDERAESDTLEAPDVDEPPVTRSGEPLDDDAAEDLARCLGELLDPGVTAIPAYVELGTFDGASVLLVGLVTIDPDTSTFTRSEVWVIERGSCEVLHFEQ